MGISPEFGKNLKWKNEFVEFRRFLCVEVVPRAMAWRLKSGWGKFGNYSNLPSKQEQASTSKLKQASKQARPVGVQ
eukprot:g40059.t1